MLKISFWLKKPNAGQDSLEHIVIANPKIVSEGKALGMYGCEVVYLPEMEGKSFPIYADNPLGALGSVLEFAKTYLQSLVFRGYTISEVENGEPWKLEKKDPQVNLREKIEAIKNNKDISQEDKDKILGVLKDTFGKSPSPIKDQINKLI